MELKVLHINFTDNGGAANAAKSLHQGLLKEGVSSTFLCLNKETDLKNSFSHRRIYTSRLQKAWYLYIKAYFTNKKNARILHKTSGKNDVLSTPYTPFDITLDPLYKEADIIHLHWTSNFLDWPSFFAKNKKPIVWTLHDRNPFSGIAHCHSGFPKELNELESDFISKKRAWVKNQNINIIAPSRLYESASLGSIVFDGFKHQTIYHGIDEHTFFPLSDARNTLQLPSSKTIVISVVSDLSRKLKGFEALVGFAKEKQDILFILVGKKDPSLEEIENILFTGEITDQKELNLYYNAADLLISNSVEESFGLTIAEALMSGTPVYSRETGFSADGSIEDLSLFNNLNDISFSKKETDQKEKISKFAQETFAISTFISKHIAVYEKLNSK